MKEDRSILIFVLYYIILGGIQASWTNLSSFPPSILRLIMIFAVFAPIYVKYSLILFAIPFSLILRGNLSTDYQYLPDVYSYDFYVVVELFAIAVHYKKLNFINFKKMSPLILLLFYMGLMDITFNGEFGAYTHHIFIAILLLPFIKSIQDYHLLSASLIVASALLAIYYIVMFESFLVIWNTKAGIERSGWGDPNYYSMLLNYGFLVSVMFFTGYLKSESLIFNKIVLTILSCFIFVAIVMTASRAGFLLFVLLLFIACITARWKWYWYILGGIIIAGLIVYMNTKGIFDTLLFRINEEGNFESGGDRFGIWDVGFSNFNNQDFIHILFGGGYWHRVLLTRGVDLHNEFFSVLLDYGILGLVIFVYFITTNCSISKKTLQRNIPVIFFVLSLLSLSPFQYVYVCFLAIWVFSLKMFPPNTYMKRK